MPRSAPATTTATYHGVTVTIDITVIDLDGPVVDISDAIAEQVHEQLTWDQDGEGAILIDILSERVIGWAR